MEYTSPVLLIVHVEKYIDNNGKKTNKYNIVNVAVVLENC
jgi:hypothetical protein